MIDKKYYYPKLNPQSVFEEFGEVYKKQLLKSNINNNFILVYEIDNVSDNIKLELLNGEKVVNNEVIFNYKEVKIVPYKFSNKSIGEYKLNEEIDLSKTYFLKGKFSVINLELVDNVTYTYNKCYTPDKCVDYEKVIEGSGTNKVLKIEYSLDINKDIFNYLKINDKRVKNLTPSNYKENEVLIEVPNEIEENIILEFDLRGESFKISK